ncbi:hypothetical protein LZL87_002853 [Fusarium oxysporum]|nr:hypothetical protein LZL87_002853 [Fusarium oxysporum]
MFTTVDSYMSIAHLYNSVLLTNPQTICQAHKRQILTNSTFITITSPTAILDASTQHYHGIPSHSDKIAIIGLTVGMAVLFLLFIVPCCCLQYLAHRQQKKEQKREAQERAKRAARLNVAAGNGSAAEQV